MNVKYRLNKYNNYLCCPKCGNFLRTINNLQTLQEIWLYGGYECKCEFGCKIKDGIKYGVYLRKKKLERIIWH